MTQQAKDNAAWLIAKLHEKGIYEKTLADAQAIMTLLVQAPEGACWSYHWCKAYSDGHNNRGLLGGRLRHYANAYADICEEVCAAAPDLEMTLDAFWLQWDRGDAFEGSASEHWHLSH